MTNDIDQMDLPSKMLVEPNNGFGMTEFIEKMDQQLYLLTELNNGGSMTKDTHLRTGVKN